MIVEFIDGTKREFTTEEIDKAIGDLLTMKPQLTAQFAEELETDIASYSFRCERFGDFLTVYMRRGGEKMAESINLMRAATISMTEGSAPSNKGTGYIAYTGLSRASMKLYTSVPRIFQRQMLTRPAPEKSGNHHARHMNQIHVDGSSGMQVSDMPQPADDDVILFSGLDVRIYAPFGCGQSVYDKIMAANAEVMRNDPAA